MKCLHSFLQRDDIQQIISRCRESKTVQGVNIHLDRHWLRAWRIGERYDPFNPKRGFEMYYKNNAQMFEFMLGIPFDSWLPIRPPDEADLDWRPPFPWGMPIEPAIVVTVRLYPKRGQRGEVPRLEANGNDFRINYVACPPARLYASGRSSHRPILGGISIGVNALNSGTLGGVLKDATGSYYGITCAHVAAYQNQVEQPSQADGGSGIASRIGAVIYAEMPPPFPSYLSPNRQNQAKNAGLVDVAIIKIDNIDAKAEIFNLGKVSDIVSLDDLEQEQRLVMTGRTSNWQILEYGGLTPYHNLKDEITGHVHCYENPLILRESNGAQPVQSGDSGAWVCSYNDNDYSWAGMVVGGDGQIGFAVAAEAIQKWWEDTPRKMNLKLL